MGRLDPHQELGDLFYQRMRHILIVLALLAVIPGLSASSAAYAGRPVRASIRFTPVLAGNYTRVEQSYQLLSTPTEENLLVSVAAGDLISLDISDGDRSLRYASARKLWCGCQDMGAFQITVTLPVTTAGYTFSVTYQYNDVGRVMQGGTFEYLVGERDRFLDMAFSLPAREIEVSEWSNPKPDTVQTHGYRLWAEYHLQDFTGPISLVYEPKGGYDPASLQTITETLTVRGTPYTFTIHYPAGAEYVKEYVRTFTRDMAPRLIADIGSASPQTTFEITIKNDIPSRPWTFQDSSSGAGRWKIGLYLNRLYRRPYLGLGHEVVHDYIRGWLPTYLEEGVANYWQYDRLLWPRWNTLGLNGHRTTVSLRAPEKREPALLAQAGYGTPTDASKGYQMGTDFIRDLATDPGKFGLEYAGQFDVNSIREITSQLRDQRASLQTVICTSGKGRLFYDLLRSSGLAQPLPIGVGRLPLMPEAEGLALRPLEECKREDLLPEQDSSQEVSGSSWLARQFEGSLYVIGFYTNMVTENGYWQNDGLPYCTSPLYALLMPYFLGGALAAAAWGWPLFRAGRRASGPTKQRVQRLLSIVWFLPGLAVVLWAGFYYAALLEAPYRYTRLFVLRLMTVAAGGFFLCEGVAVAIVLFLVAHRLVAPGMKWLANRMARSHL